MRASAFILLLCAALASATPVPAALKGKRLNLGNPLSIPLTKRGDVPDKRGEATVYTSCVVDNMVAITFDDGPYIYEQDIVNTLNDAGIKGTFFVNGNNWDCIYDQYSSLQNAYWSGHQIGSHTWDHPDLTTLGWDDIESEFYRIEDALHKIIGAQPAFFRPPYGSYNDDVLQIAAEHGMTVILWDLDSGDSVGEPVWYSEQQYDDAVSSHPDNVLALNHETYDTTAYQVLPYAIKVLQDAGYTFGTVADCVGWQEPYQWTTKPGSPDLKFLHLIVVLAVLDTVLGDKMSGSDSETGTPPLSAATTLTPGSPSSDPSPPAKGWDVPLLKPSLPLPVPPPSGSTLPTTAAHVVEALASSLSTHVFAYDDALHFGFGQQALGWSSEGQGAKAQEMQARTGAGLALLGRLGSASGGSTSAAGGTLSAFVTPPGLALMSQTLALLPPPSQAGRLVLQVPAVSTEPSGTLTASLSALGPALAGVPSDSQELAVLLSSTPAETALLAQASYAIAEHAIHIFDHHSSARELTAVPSPQQLVGEGALSLSAVLARLDLEHFDYSGDAEAEHVVVLLNSPLAQALKASIGESKGLGLLVVRVLRPWDELALAAALPSSVKHVHVVDHVQSALDPGVLYGDVLGALVGGANPDHPIVHRYGVLPSELSAYTSRPADLLSALRPTVPSPAKLHLPQPKKLAFYTTPASSLPQTIAHTFLLSNSVSTRLLSSTDAFSHAGGVSLHRLLLHRPSDSGTAQAPVDYLFRLEQPDADFVALAEPALLKSHAVLSSACKGAQVLVIAPWSAEELLASLPPKAHATVEEKQLRLYTFDLRKAAEALAPSKGKQEAQEELDTVLQLIAFLRLYLVGAGGEAAVEKVVRAIYGSSIGGVPLTNACKAVWKSLHEVVLPKHEPEVEVEKEKELKTFEFNTISAATTPVLSRTPVPRVSSWHAAAKLLLFREATLIPSATDPKEQPAALRPETEDGTYLVTCTVNRRLTPTTYDRNVFHLEFDTAGTGLKYALGEALGIHGWNDEQEVLDFCEWYGVDPNQVISVPLPDGSRGARHTRTVFQTLQQVADLFGKPPKSFYAALSPLATERAHSMALRFISSAEGSATFKKLSEVDTLNFADVLRMYPSAHPSIEELVELIGFIKPRHYSIASSQAAVGDRVDLLVVTVDWVTPSGSPRYGQCTRYLAGLKEGQKVTVSIKPSVMKLPPNDLQPIIMAGLGTGAAPFRAFMQHRAWQAAQKIPVGPLIYYFGSRHRSQEYLYGEEIEAYIRDGVISHAGLAFSRDTKKKVYIQHKMQNDGEMLGKMLGGEDKGVFYLCGPTWPVPDVYEALVKSLVEYGGMERKEAEEYLEALKEEERYVLEVY
ncbi:carbohydrate esterase family 4 protein [Calocera viscosa TUFC12733]|uniref:assimilatory sulfite reductase (NADPH) n=1 Tax=Calocera viscosa (strain TUFC12733) TaxID=1330018 RepID=A0A167NDU3_CALVF|nr:carbohydrate esterase family 4 protein [Calocera viscosa TUFC12733]